MGCRRAGASLGRCERDDDQPRGLQRRAANGGTRAARARNAKSRTAEAGARAGAPRRAARARTRRSTSRGNTAAAPRRDTGPGRPRARRRRRNRHRTGNDGGGLFCRRLGLAGAPPAISAHGAASADRRRGQGARSCGARRKRDRLPDRTRHGLGHSRPRTDGDHRTRRAAAALPAGHARRDAGDPYPGKPEQPAARPPLPVSHAGRNLRPRAPCRGRRYRHRRCSRAPSAARGRRRQARRRRWNKARPHPIR